MSRFPLIAICFLIVSCNGRPSTADNAKQTGIQHTNTNSGVTIAAPLATDVANVAGLDKYMKQFERPTQHFSVQADSNSVVIGAKGTRISVVPADLEGLDGSRPSGNITVDLIELQTQEDLLRNGMATTSNGKLLESGGSYYINMSAGGKQLRLKAGRELAVIFPKKSSRDMQLYYGVKNADGDVNWLPSKGVFVPLKAEDSVLVSTEVARYKDTILEKMEMRPDHEQRKIGAERLRQFAPVGIKMIDGTFYFVGRTRDMANRAYTTKKEASVKQVIGSLYESIRMSRLGWSNIDRPANLDILALQSSPLRNTGRPVEAFIVYKEINSVIRKRLMLDDDNKLEIEGNAKSHTVKIIALAWRNGVISACSQTLNTATNTTIRLDMKPITREGLERMISL